MLSAGRSRPSTPLHERDAYRAIFSFGGSLAGLKPNPCATTAAISNAREFMVEVIATLKRQAEEPRRGKGGVMSGSRPSILFGGAST